MDTGVAARGLEIERTEASFEVFFEREFASVTRAVGLVVGDAAEAEELAEEAFARAWDRWDRVSTIASPAGYVDRTAVNLNRNRLRRIGRELRRRRPQPPTTTPTDAVDERDRIRRALAALPFGQRQAIPAVPDHVSVEGYVGGGASDRDTRLANRIVASIRFRRPS